MSAPVREEGEGDGPEEEHRTVEKDQRNFEEASTTGNIDNDKTFIAVNHNDVRRKHRDFLCTFEVLNAAVPYLPTEYFSKRRCRLVLIRLL